MLSGGVTFLTVRFGLGLAEDAADALYTCYNLDINSGVKHRDEVFEAVSLKLLAGRLTLLTLVLHLV